MSSPKEPKDPKDRWWNEWPIEGPEHRPAVWLTKLLSKTPLLIGWDDEKIEREAMASLSEALGREVTDISDLSQFPNGPKEGEPLFPVPDIVSKMIINKFLNLEVTDDDEDGSGGKKTLKEIGGNVFQEDAEVSTIHDTELYKLSLRNLQYQRDLYLVGKEYADRRKHERKMNQDFQLPEKMGDTAALGDLSITQQYNSIPHDATALGNIQLQYLGSWFIPSTVVYRALLPIVTSLPTGVMHQPILQSTTSLIPLFQGNLDQVVKEQLLWVLDNQEWRDIIKSSTKGYITNTYVDSTKK